MNHILHNISLVILATGIILMTIYITKASNNGYMSYEKSLINLQSGLRRRETPDNIYDYRVSKAYKKMFSQPSVWAGYQDFDPEEKTDKIFVK
jgi:hypothetical protein